MRNTLKSEENKSAIFICDWKFWTFIALIGTHKGSYSVLLSCPLLPDTAWVVVWFIAIVAGLGQQWPELLGEPSRDREN